MYITMSFTVPSSPPQNFTTMVISSTSISVYWDPPPLGDQNGVITGYRVIIINLNRTSISVNVNVFGTNFTAMNLEEFEAYNIQVAAMTAVGLGPFSNVIRSQTFEDGKYCVVVCILCPYVVMLCFYGCSSVYGTSKCAG